MRARSRGVALIVICGFLYIGMALGQQQGGGQQPAPPPGGGGAAGGGATAPGNVPGRGGQQQPGMIPGRDTFFGDPRQQQQQRSPLEQRPIFLSGKVVLDDGTPPPEPVTIERVCNGQVRPEAYTDSKGRFSFQLGQNNNVMMDASVSNSGPMGMGRDSMSGFGGPPGPSGGGMNPRDLMGCELRASLAGFRSEAVMLSQRSMFDNPDVGTIILHRLANVQGSAISFTTLAAPKDAKKSFDKAYKITHEKSPKHAEAAKELEKAVEIYPKYAAAWYELGKIRLALKDEPGARQAFEQSLAADAKYVNPYLDLAALDLRASRWASAADITGKLVQLNPYQTQAHYFNAVANFYLGKMDVAEKSARTALEGDPNKRNPMMQQLLGAILARQGNFPLAAEHFRNYLKLSPDSPNADQVRKQLAEWEGLGVIQRAEAAPK